MIDFIHSTKLADSAVDDKVCIEQIQLIDIADITVPFPFLLPPPPPVKQGNVYANLTLIVFREVTLIYAK